MQTRTIGLSEARKELSCWRDPALEEVTSLEVTNEAVVRTDVRQVDQWVEQGISVIQLPGKCVCAYAQVRYREMQMPSRLLWKLFAS